MFNLLVSSSGWGSNRDSISISRTFEYTLPHITSKFRVEGSINFEELKKLPTLFMEESWGQEPKFIRVGTLVSAYETGKDISLEYYFDPDIPPIQNSTLEGISKELGIDDFEFHRTHWAIKEHDLFKALFKNIQPRRLQPKVFFLSEHEAIESVLVSAMMPFSPQFNAVHQTLVDSTATFGLRLRRADDIWENPSIIQDIVSLIDKSKIIICDCTGKNANVFYEIGIAHTLGREVILITQSEHDIPFDLRHLRYISYLNNGEGLKELRAKLEQRIAAIIGA